jgi:hypothetical protein
MEGIVLEEANKKKKMGKKQDKKKIVRQAQLSLYRFLINKKSTGIGQQR